MLFILDTSQIEQCYVDGDFDFDTFETSRIKGFLCVKDNLCIYENLVCDGQRNCPSGEDENIDFCMNRTKNFFPNAATVRCNETGRPNDSWVEILAIRCNGKGTIHILHNISTGMGKSPIS